MIEEREQVRQDVANEVTIPVKKEMRFVGAMRPKRGQKVFKFVDSRIVELQPEDYEEDDTLNVEHVNIAGMQASIKRRKVRIDPNARYVCAINYKNAIRKLLKAGLIQPK